MGTEPPPNQNGKVFPLPGKALKNLPDVKYWKPEQAPLSSDVIQHGCTYTSKVKNEHASCGGANMMVPLLKHWTALPALSYFLTNSMHIRESSRRIVVPSTFKPPPRMNMPDAKRDAWLTDLSNPQYPLRKLGRTVPQSLKGGELLEQLYRKKVPLFRGLWLIKCVGASELRSLKRKMASLPSDKSPESIWLAEWTQQVLDKFQQTTEEFDDTHEWGEKCCYILDTVAMLFSEGLLDQVKLVSWTLGLFDDGPLTILPAVVYLVNKIWPALIRESSAVRLAEAICTRAATISPSADKTLHVVDALLLRLFESCPDAFILPHLWPKLEIQLKRAATLPALFTKVTRYPPEILKSIDLMKQRNSIFMVSKDTTLSPQWQSAIKINDILSQFSLPFSIPDLVSQLRSLQVPLQELFDALMTWTIRRANDRAIHLVLAICQQMTAMGAQLGDHLVNFLVRIKPSQVHKSLFNLLGWLIKSEIFSIEKYFRRLIASGVMHLNGPEQGIHQSILRNLPFSFMNRTLKGQTRMLLREDIEDKSSIVDDLAARADQLYDALEPAPLSFPPSLLRDQELRLAEKIFESYKQHLAHNPAKITPLLLSAIVKTIDNLCDKFTIFKIVWLTFSKFTTQSLYIYNYQISTQYTYFFLCMRSIAAIVQVAYDRRSYFTVNIQHSFETSAIVMIIRDALRDKPESRLLDSYLKSIESLYVPSNMTPENDDELIDGIAAGEFINQALDKDDRPAILRLCKHFFRQPSQFVSQFSDWLEKHPNASVELIAWLLSNFCLHFSDVYNMLVDKRNDLLYDLLFEPEKSFGLEPTKREYLYAARQTFIMLSPPEEVLYILSKVESPQKLVNGVELLLQRARHNSDTCSDLLFNFQPESPEKDACLKQCVQNQIGLSFESTTPEQRFYQLLDACNAFNTGFCQIGCWLNFKDFTPERTVELVLSVLKSGKIDSRTSSWQVIFKLLDSKTKKALHAAAEAEFLTGPVPNPCVGHLVLILMSLEPFSDSATRVHDHSSELINYVGQVTNACKYRTVTAAEIKPTLMLLLKLIVNECAPTSEAADNTTLDAEYSKVLLPTVSALCLGLQQSSVVEENGELSSMVSDALRILNRREDSVNTPNFNVLHSSLSGLMMYSRSNNTYTNLDAWPFDLIEETASGSGNDVSLDLSRFETYVEIKDTL